MSLIQVLLTKLNGGPTANIFFPDDNNKMLHIHSLTWSDERLATSSSCYYVQKYDHISEEIWSPEQLYSASAEDKRPDITAKVGPKLENLWAKISVISLKLFCDLVFKAMQFSL